MRFPLLPWALALLCVTLHAEPVDSLIKATDLLKLNQLAEPALSPDGTTIAYTVRTLEAQPAGDAVYRNRLWLATTSGEAAPRELATAGLVAHSPAWHPSGDRLAYVRPESDGDARIWVLPFPSGEPYPVTPPMRGAASPQWSPDGTRLLFTAIVTYAEVQATLAGPDGSLPSPPWRHEQLPPITVDTAPPDPKKPAAAAPEPSPDGTTQARLAWLALNEARRNPSVTHRPDFNLGFAVGNEPEFTHVFLVNRADSEPINLTPGFHSRENPAWFPDSRRIVCSGPSNDNEHPDRALTRHLLLIDLDGTATRPLLKSVAFSLDHPVVSPDGQHVACTAQPALEPADLGFGQTRIGVVTVNDPELRILTDKLDRSAENPRWSADGKFIHFTAETNGGAPLHRVALVRGNPERITSPDTWVTGHSAGPADLALIVARPNNPGELYRTRVNGRDARILTAHNSEWLRDRKTANPERRKLKRPDGLEIDYWVVKPPYLEGGFRYPLLVMIHGGPASMWGASNPELWHELQFFAARGYGIVFANPRGSSGYGHKFQRANFQNWAEGPAGDVLAAAEAIAKENWADAHRQVILGGSYGAYLATWIVATDNRFQAAIASRGVYDLTTFFGQGDAWPLVPWHFGGYPWQPEVRKLLDAQSPLTRVDSIRTPLLIKQNDSDHQTGIAQGELLYRSLKLLHRPVELVRYPHASHDLSRHGDPAHRIDRLVRFDAFFQRFIGTPAQPIPPPPPPVPAPAPMPPPPAPAPEGMMMMSP